MRYGSVCSGIEAATVAWHGLGWEPQWFSEIEQFPSAVLKHNYPDVPNHGDMTQYKDWPNDKTIDLLVGGTPCQSFSVAGLRAGLDDPRGNLALTFIAMAERLKPQWIVWENVPGVLSSNRGRDFGSFLSALGNIGYGWAYRILDSQYFGVPQRRRRVFVVGHLGDWRSASEVLFESESLSGNPPPCRKTRERVADTLTVGANQYSGFNGEPVVSPYREKKQETTGYTSSSFGAYREGVGTVRASGGDLGGGSETLALASPYTWPADVTSTLNASFAHKLGLENQHAHNGASMFVPDVRNTMGTITARMFNALGVRDVEEGALVPCKETKVVRRLTPIECERLQGFPDNYTQIPYRNKKDVDCPVGPRYKALGNSMTVNVMRWIGEQIDEKGL